MRSFCVIFNVNQFTNIKKLALKISKNLKVIGPRQGEKLEEILITEEEKRISQEKTDMWIIQNYK